MIDLRIVFMGTPEFAVPSLDILIKNKFNVVGVITMPDKPAGRGQQIQESAIKKYALQNNLNILQPENLKSQTFIDELKSLNANLQIVVAFRMLPEVVWNMPELGTFNLHGSLLPQYRGAAPINWAIINGEKETGVTTFFLKHQIDTGNILYNEKIKIEDDFTAGEVHDKLMHIGAELVLKTTKSIQNNNYTKTEQSNFYNSENELKHAPKIFKDDCRINWTKDINQIHNHIRGLSPYPTAFTELINPENKTYLIKIYKSKKEYNSHNTSIKAIITDKKNYLKISVNGGFIELIEIQIAGKKKMHIQDFLRGFDISNDWRVL